MVMQQTPPNFDHLPGLEQMLGRMHRQQICCDVAKGADSTMNAAKWDMGVCVGRKKDHYRARFSEDDTVESCFRLTPKAWSSPISLSH